jgi:chromosome segregation ATPase
MTIERRTSERRKPSTAAAQDQIDTRAIEKVTKVEADLEGHEDLCTERFNNLNGKVDDVKDQVSDIKNDIKNLSDKQEKYHKTNSEALESLQNKFATMQNANKIFGLPVLDWIKVGIPFVTLIYLIMGHGK